VRLFVSSWRGSTRRLVEREARCVLLSVLVEAFVPDGTLVVGIDETLEKG
jgi:hypothetical protein